MIPLSALLDPAAFLAGARVPLVLSAADEYERGLTVEWSIDHIAEVNRGRDALLYELQSFHATTPERWYQRRRSYYAPEDGQRLALDPTDPDVARWCDRRIAEAMGAPDGSDPVLVIHRGRWRMDMRSCPNRCPPLLTTIDLSPANAPAVRAALVLALYGRTP